MSMNSRTIDKKSRALSLRDFFFQESTFIEQLVEDESQMEGLPKDCSKVMVWHLHLEATQLYYPQSWLMKKNLDIVATLT